MSQDSIFDDDEEQELFPLDEEEINFIDGMGLEEQEGNERMMEVLDVNMESEDNEWEGLNKDDVLEI